MSRQRSRLRCNGNLIFAAGLIVILLLIWFTYSSFNTENDVPLEERKLQREVPFKQRKQLEETDLLKSKVLNPEPKEVEVFEVRPSQMHSDHHSKYPILNEFGKFIPSRRIVHLDLKGAQPKVDFYGTFFPFIAKLGATGVLIEYEDTFPYTGILELVKSSKAYSKDDLHSIIQYAKLSNLEIIPLVQSFGHLEWILKLEKFASFREVPKYPQVVCLSNFDGIHLIKTAIDQVMEFHKDTSEFFHIGADEAYYVGKCQKCNFTIHQEMGGSKDRLMLRHIANISSHVKMEHGKKVLMWHDMLDSIDPKLLIDYKLADLVEPVLWAYAEDLNIKRVNDTFAKFSAASLPYLWGASVFKGADGPSRIYSNVSRYLHNHESWIGQMTRNYKNFKEFRGLILTGWQRFDHFAVMCELLPVGIPSLVVNLLTIANARFDDSIKTIALKLMDCKQDTIFELGTLNVTHGCNFPGSRVYESIQQLAIDLADIKSNVTENSRVTGFLTTYNSKYSYSNVALMEIVFGRTQFHLKRLEKRNEEIRQSMANIFHQETIDEFLLTYLKPEMEILKKLGQEADRLSKIMFFPVKEFPGEL